MSELRPTCNEKKFTSLEIAEITKGTLIGPQDNCFFSCFVDSREVTENSLFVALAGEKSDGHLFLLDAAKNGASIFIVEKKRLPSTMENSLTSQGKALVVVEDSLLALQQLATAHVKKFPNLIKIGITGSSGKTTTKEILFSLLSVKYNTFKTFKNLNSEIGLPLMALSIESTHQVAILEMGIDHVGEMEKLVSIFDPDYALITSIGTAHIGRFGSQEILSNEKGKIFSRFGKKNFALVNRLDNLALKEKEKYEGTTICYGLQEVAKGKYQVGNILMEDRGLLGWEFSVGGKGESVLFSLVGKHNILNFAGCYEIGKLLGLSEADILQGVSFVKPLFGRGVVKPFENDIILIEDCYNANGESTLATIEFFNNLSVRRRKVLLLGSMKELGPQSKQIHSLVGEVLSSSTIDTIFLTGSETIPIFERLRSESNYKEKLYYIEEKDQLSHAISEYKRPGDLWLFKASRSLFLEELEASLGAKKQC